MTILLTGGAGYIGSHIATELLDCGYRVVIMDNLSNSSVESISRIQAAAGKPVVFYEADIRDGEALSRIFAKETVEAVIHLAGLKALGASVHQPFEYYENNLVGTYTLCRSMAAHQVKHLIFSSSAAVYGATETIPLREEAPLRAATPYGKTKLMIEGFLQDIAAADPDWAVIALRYFNPMGAHASGLMGESPKGLPENLMPALCRVAAGEQPYLSIFGTDYPTPDGTGIRDYIHVTDLARGHIKALETLTEKKGMRIYNLGRGQGSSVLEVTEAFATATGISIPYKGEPRRSGDIAICYTDASKARKELGWETQYNLQAMCSHAWQWHINSRTKI